MEASKAAEVIRQEGFVILSQLIDAELIAKLKQALAPWLQGRYPGRNNFEGFSTERVYALLAKDEVFAELVEHPIVLGIIDQLLAQDYLLSANLAINIHPGETPQPYHTDASGMPHTDRSGPHGISAIWALDDFTEENGATELIPRSHLWQGEQPREDDERAIKAIMPAGSVLLFSGSLYHRGGANHGQENRLAITPQYCQPWLRQLENMVLVVPPKMAAKYSERIQALLGYSVRAPGFMGYVDGLHPRRLIDQSYQGRKARGELS